MNALDSIGLEEDTTGSPKQIKHSHGRLSKSPAARKKSGSASNLHLHMGVEDSRRAYPQATPIKPPRISAGVTVAAQGGMTPTFAGSSQELRNMSGSRGVVATLLKRQQQQQRMQLYQQHPSSPTAHQTHSSGYQALISDYATPVPRQAPHQLSLALSTAHQSSVSTDLRRVVPVIWTDAQQPQIHSGNAAISTSVPDVRRVFYSGYL